MFEEKNTTRESLILKLLEDGDVMIKLDAREHNVIVPKNFKTNPELYLLIGLNLAIPIHDLKIDESGISGIFSFNRKPETVSIPMDAISEVWSTVTSLGFKFKKPSEQPPSIDIVEKKKPHLRIVK